MVAIARSPKQKPASRRRNDKFLAMLPAISEQANFTFRRLPVEAREELVQEVVAQAYSLFLRLCQRRKPALIYATPLAQFAIKKVRAGRRIGSPSNIRDITSPRAAVTKGFAIERLDRFNRRTGRSARLSSKTGRQVRPKPLWHEWTGPPGCALCLDVSARSLRSSPPGKRRELLREGSALALLGSARCGSGFERVGRGFTAIHRRYASLAAELPIARVPAGAESIMLGAWWTWRSRVQESKSPTFRLQHGRVPFRFAPPDRSIITGSRT
jgi:hypothetical protein